MAKGGLPSAPEPTPVLPWDLAMMNILVRLPIRDLLRLRCVSKSWCAAISSHLFAYEYLRQHHAKSGSSSLSLEAHVLVHRYRCTKKKSSLTLLRVDNQGNVKGESVGLADMVPFEFARDKSSRFTRLSDGIVAVTDDDFHRAKQIVLLNPMSRDSKCINLPDLQVPGCNPPAGNYAFAFGHIPAANPDGTNACVLVRLVEYPSDDKAKTHPTRYQIDVYSFGRDSWTTTAKDTGGRVGICRNRGSICVRGVCYWVGLDKGSGMQVVISFDVQTQAFRTIQPPEKYDTIHLEELGDALCLVGEGGGISYQVWVLDYDCHRTDDTHDSWTKELTIDMNPFKHIFLGFWPRTNIAILFDKHYQKQPNKKERSWCSWQPSHKHRNQLVLCDPTGNDAVWNLEQHLQDWGNSIRDNNAQVVVCKETLVSFRPVSTDHHALHGKFP